MMISCNLSAVGAKSLNSKELVVGVGPERGRLVSIAVVECDWCVSVGWLCTGITIAGSQGLPASSELRMRRLRIVAGHRDALQVSTGDHF